MKATFLGTGTSQGVPVIGCHCKVCESTNPKDKRLRTAFYIEDESTAIVIDAGPDFRQQMLRERIEKLDAIFITHEHNDHVIGLDEVRPFNFMQEMDMPVFATAKVCHELKQRFHYVFNENNYPGAPKIKLSVIEKDKAASIKNLYVIPIEVIHGSLPVLGFRIGKLTYITDAKIISNNEKEKIYGTEILILNALRHESHHSHLNLGEALSLITDINPGKAYLTHISHQMGLSTQVAKTLPKNVYLAYDGLTIEV